MVVKTNCKLSYRGGQVVLPRLLRVTVLRPPVRARRIASKVAGCLAVKNTES